MIYLINIKIHIITFVDVKSSTYINSSGKVNNKDPKFKISDIVRISKYKKIFPNDSLQIDLKKFFELITVPWTNVINDLNGEEIIGTFYKEKFQKTNQKVLRTEKVIKRIDDE